MGLVSGVHEDEMVEIDRSERIELLAVDGRLALDRGDQERARCLLAEAVDLSSNGGGDLVDRARLLHDLARATDGCGRIAEARGLFVEVIRLAAVSGEHELVVDAAVRSVFPVDWRAGDREAAALLKLAEGVHGTGPRAAAILAARAMVEMRVPASEEQGHQIAWVTRANVAQPLAERALSMTEDATDGDRLLALVAWRQTHRGPRHLERRLSVSGEAADLAQRLLDHDRLADAAAAAVVDHLEVGSRARSDEALTVLRWAADNGDNPRLQWLAATLSVGSALLDGDVDTAVRLRADAVEIGQRRDLPGWLAGEILLAAATEVTSDDRAAMAKYLVPLDTPAAASPVARSTVAWAAVHLGEVELGLKHARLAARTLNEESSYLLCLTLLARVAAATGDRDLVELCESRLAPWAGRLVVDGVGWWCDGPVDLALAELATATGRYELGATHLAAADTLARTTGDRSSQPRIDAVAARLAEDPTAWPLRSTVPGFDLLSERERRVLVLIAGPHR